MKIYVITEGDYSDYHIVGVTLDRKKAEAYCKLARGNYYVPDVEEYETDLFDGIEGRKPYSVELYKDGLVEVKELDSRYESKWPDLPPTTDEVVAWMPLPKPYKKKGGTK